MFQVCRLQEGDVEPLKDPSTPLRQSQLFLRVQTPEPFSYDPPSYEGVIVEQNYADSVEEITASPRSRYKRFHPEDIFHLPQYAGLKEWFLHNVSSYLEHKANWSSHIPPQRALYIYGPRGMGRAINLANLCRAAGVNFLFLRSCVEDPAVFSFIIRKAKAMAPCMILFDDATYIAQSRSKPFMSALKAAVLAQLDIRSDDVWLVFTSDANPALAYDAGHNLKVNDPPLAASFESMCSFIKEFGSFAFVPSIQFFQSARELVVQLLKNATRNISFFDSHPWIHTLNHMASASLLCTVKEVDEFIVKAMQLHYSRLLKTPPTPAFFEERLSALSSISSISDDKVMTIRLVEQDNTCVQDNMRFTTALNIFCIAHTPAHETPKATTTLPPIQKDREQLRDEARKQRSSMTPNVPDELNFDFLSTSSPSSLVEVPSYYPALPQPPPSPPSLPSLPSLPPPLPLPPSITLPKIPTILLNPTPVTEKEKKKPLLPPIPKEPVQEKKKLLPIEKEKKKPLPKEPTPSTEKEKKKPPPVREERPLRFPRKASSSSSSSLPPLQREKRQKPISTTKEPVVARTGAFAAFYNMKRQKVN